MDAGDIETFPQQPLAHGGRQVHGGEDTLQASIPVLGEEPAKPLQQGLQLHDQLFAQMVLDLAQRGPYVIRGGCQGLSPPLPSRA